MENKPLTAKEKKALLNNPENTAKDETKTALNYNIPATQKQFSIPTSSTVNLNQILSKRINESVKINPIVPTVFIAESRFAVKGDISMISGKPKAGKSTITKMVLATALMADIPDGYDTLSIRSKYCEGQPVIYIDTEQNPADTLEFHQEVIKITGLKKTPDNFIVLNWRDFDYNECLNHLVAIFEQLKNIYMIVIDGITDLIPSSNDETSSVMLIRYLMKESTVRNTCVIACIHENGESGKMRGHIGAEAARKCQGTISIRYDEAKGVRVIKPLFLRRGKMFEEIYWESNEGIPRSCSAELTEKLKNEEALEDKRAKECTAILDLIYTKAPKQGFNSAELMKYTKIYQPAKNNESADACRKRASRYIETMKKLELISENANMWTYEKESNVLELPM
jgi:predicted house-cleaning noncanonical NTP pyrophosphatase (MazG superfamily)